MPIVIAFAKSSSLLFVSYIRSFLVSCSLCQNLGFTPLQPGLLSQATAAASFQLLISSASSLLFLLLRFASTPQVLVLRSPSATRTMPSVS
ncbi:uncharacterized protein K441DRAFT_52112 [Cenococcum geophilum 1.58]|uniref:Uncharacterized protein n=1 Tax=Cenococcum geophilum 1.58 TaxID=794803 RepID=A0ACC8EK12_9PEZI|nr:hypothetical protein K441DRAFT_52112 [Cenococcum geophilum 1.58]